MCQVIAPLDDDLRAEAEARLLARLGHKTPTQLRAAAHRLVQRLDGAAIGRRVQTALRERGVTVYPTGDGLGSLSVTDLPLPVLRAVEDALCGSTPTPPQTPGDDRTRQQRMVDCLIDLVLRPGAHGLAPVQAQLTIIATIGTLLGGDDPGEISGDVVPAQTVRALARALGLLPAGDPPSATTRGTATAADARRRRLRAALLARRDPGDRRASPTCSPPHPRGTALAARPHIALADELTGQLLALTDAAGLRAGRALGPPPPTDAYRPTDPLKRFVQHPRPTLPLPRLPPRPPTAATPTTSPAGPTATPPPTTSAACAATTTDSSTKHPAGNCTPSPTAPCGSPPPPARCCITRPAGLSDDEPPPRTNRPRRTEPSGDDPPPF